MRKIDLLIGAVLVLAVVFSIVGAATYEAQGPPEYDYAVSFKETDRQFSMREQAAPANGGTFDLEQPYGNVSRVNLTVKVEGRPQSVQGQRVVRAQDVTIIITVTSKKGSVSSSPLTLAAGGSGGSVSAPFSFTFPMPNATKVRAHDEAEAGRELARLNNESQARGTWKIQVSVNNPNPGPVQETYSVSAQGTARTYEGVLQLKAPDVNR